jgi:ligand-binding sensor domain-containing protein/anti-sigma regulatory factor (Ser/Thr protein kinase)
MRNWSIITLYLLAFMATFTPAGAQDIPHFIERLTTIEGLTSNSINDLAQDENGFLWIATPDGLNRFDGAEVVQYYHQDIANSLPHNYVYCLKKLAGNYLAIGTQKGLSFYDATTGVFHNFYHRLNNPLDDYNNAVTKLEIDALGNLWAASDNCIFIFDVRHRLKKVIPSPFTIAEIRRQRARFVEKMIPLTGGDMLLFLHDGWHVYAHGSGVMINWDLDGKGLAGRGLIRRDLVSGAAGDFPAARLFSICERHLLYIPPHGDSLELLDEKGRLLDSRPFPYNKYPYISWSQQAVTLDTSNILLLLHNFGLIMIRLSWQHGQPSFSFTSTLQFGSSEYNTALMDAQGNWWLATTREGLQKISPSRQYFNGKALIDTHSGEPARYEATYASRWNSRLWVSTYGNGFFGIDALSGREQQYLLTGTGDDTWANFIWNIRQVDTDTLWVGTQTGLFWYSLASQKCGRLPAGHGKPAALDSVAITTQFMDSQGLVWMGMGKGRGLCYWDPARRRFQYYPGNDPQGYPLRYPLHIAEGRQGSLWFTSDASTQLVHWDRPSGRFQVMSLPASVREQAGALSGIYSEGDSVLWLGSITCGLLKYTLSTGAVNIYGHERGLSNSHISSIYQDARKRLWLVTEGGLACFHRQTESFTNYSVKEGLPVTYPTADFFYDTLSGRLYTGGHGSLIYFDPVSICPVSPPGKTLITALRVNGNPWMPEHDGPIHLSAQQNDITIQYGTVDLTDGEDLRYAYRLKGVDTGWVMAGRQRQINFSRLAPGEYTFMVHTAGADGEFSGQVASVSFRISPPFSRTIGFYALILLALGGLSWTLYHFRQRQINRTKQIRSEISRNLHDEVGANLTNISLSSLLAKKQIHDEYAVSQLLERIYQDSQTVSEAMREIVWSIDPSIDTLGDALPRMLHYASKLLEANNMELQAEILPAVEDIKFSMQQRRDIYLIFKEAVNNMARHSQATAAFIHLSEKRGTFIMTITDNGRGFDTGAVRISNGLKNMRERAREHSWQLDIRSGTGSGTTIVLYAGIA